MTVPAVVRQPRARDFQPLTINDATTFAQAVAKADGMIPRAYLGNPGKILACVLAGQELGVGPMASLRAFHIVEGKPVASYDFWIARLRAAGYRVEWPELSTERVTLRLTSPAGETHTETWDKARAQAAGLWNGKDPWRKYPQTMLQARCVATAGRAFAGEVMFGCYEADEADALRGDVQAAPAAPQAPVEPQQRLAVAVGVQADPDAAKVVAKARELAERCKAAGWNRDQLFAVMADCGVQAQRLSECSLAQLDMIDGALQLALADTVATAAREESRTLPPADSVYPRESRYAGD
jgi:hypothetical protein